MKSSGKRNLYSKVKKVEPKDRISNLPSDLLENILERLPLRDATRTCILSRRWRYSSASLSIVDFDEEFGRQELKKSLDHRHTAAVISEILLLHKAPILKFYLSPPPTLLHCFNDRYIDKWMLFLSRNGVEELGLFSEPQASYRLGSPFFSCSKLTNLELQYYIFEPPSSFNGFEHLTSLTFYSVNIKSKVLESLISAAPLLLNLTLQCCPGLDTFNISASNLEYFLIEGAFKSITLANTPNLVEAELCVHQTGNHPVQKKSNLIDVCSSMPKIEKLVLSDHGCGIFAAGGVPTKLPTELIQLEHLILSHTIFTQADEFECALCLIRSSPNLLTLEISSRTTPTKSFGVAPVQTAMKLSEDTCLTLDKLQVVKMMDVMGTRRELCFIKSLLASTPRLETMSITRQINLHHKTEAMLSSKLLKYPRASPTAKIIYLEPDDEED